jgi:2-haloacid dehalogenase
MRQVLAFDVYGTLIDTAGVVTALRGLVGNDADRFAAVWRDKQLEYSFRRGLMRSYTDFAVCIRDALEYTSRYLDTPLDAKARASLLETYRELPAFADVGDSLGELAAGPFDLYAFSNGAAATVDRLLSAAGIRMHFHDIVSVEEVGSFKPDPRVYRHFLTRAAVEAASAWLVSGNPFDVLGAMAVGMQGIWVRRNATALFDPWGVEPSLTVAGLGQIGAAITGQTGPARA